MTLSALVRQTGQLANDLVSFERQLEPQLERVRPLLKSARYIAVGSGDSHFAAQAAAPAWRELAGVDLAIHTPQSLLYFSPEPHELVIATSASGRSSATVEMLRTTGARKLAITSTAQSLLATLADGALETTLSGNEPSPGVRTYQASLVTHLYLAATIGLVRNFLTAEEVARQRTRIFGLAQAIQTTLGALRAPCTRLASAIAGANVVTVLGSGPNLGTAQYAAAKLVESAGQLAIGRDVEEWWHVERFVAPGFMPLVVLAPAGRSHRRAMEVVAGARALGHHVTLVADPELYNTGISDEFLPVPDVIWEFLSPLLQGLFAPLLAIELARMMKRVPFGMEPKRD